MLVNEYRLLIKHMMTSRSVSCTGEQVSNDHYGDSQTSILYTVMPITGHTLAVPLRFPP